MLKKIVIFDIGFGGELFADYVEKELAIIDTIRVIDWRESPNLYKNPHLARKNALEILRPYINKVDVIVIANYFISSIGLDYFRDRYPSQKFVGFSFPQDSARNQRAFILPTKSLRMLPSYQLFKYRLHAKTQEFDCEAWARMMDDGELTPAKITEDLQPFADFKPQKVYMLCTHLPKIKPTIRKIFGGNVKIEDGYKQTYKDLCVALGFKGIDGRKKK